MSISATNSFLIILILSFHWSTPPGRILFDDFYHDVFNLLKKEFTSVPIFTYWISNVQLIVKTDISDYTLVAILFIIDENNKVHLVAFHSQTFTSVVLNYNTYGNKLLVIFKAFRIWCYCLKNLVSSINIVFFSHFNLIIQFCLSYFSMKPNALTR